KSRIETHLLDGQTIKVFYDPLQPPWRLLMFGAGIDAIPVVQLAKTLGWRVTVVDHRAVHLQKDRFAQAYQLLNSLPEHLGEHLVVDQFNAALLMTHNIEYDQRYLKAILNSDISFIGLLGPAHRKDRLLHSLGNEAVRIRHRVFGPVGLDIGAETPEEIALSIMAGIHAVLSGRIGQILEARAFKINGVRLD
ncbi:MAG: XdhC family protein, partial [Methylococcales bacterium]